MQSETLAVPALQHKAIQDKENHCDWRVEAIDSKAGDVYIAIFAGPLAERRAIEYAKFKNASLAQKAISASI